MQIFFSFPQEKDGWLKVVNEVKEKYQALKKVPFMVKTIVEQVPEKFGECHCAASIGILFHLFFYFFFPIYFNLFFFFFFFFFFF